MGITWHVLMWAWTTVVIAYCVLHMMAAKRLHGQAARLSRNIFVVMAVLILIKFGVSWVLGRSMAYRLAVLFVGVAAGVAALVEARMLFAKKADDETPTVPKSGFNC